MKTQEYDSTKKIFGDIGNDMFSLMTELFPICRSITGNGVRKTLKIIQSHIPLQINEIPSNTQVFDWTIPKEWNIEDAYVIDPNGKKIIDFKKNNLHLVGYSTPQKNKIFSKKSQNKLEKPESNRLPEYMYRGHWVSDDLLFSIEETSTVVFFKSGEVDTYVTVALFRTGSELFKKQSETIC